MDITVNRPGISSKVLQLARIRRVDAADAEQLCGLAQPGNWIPYFDLSGTEVIEDGRPYGRLRLDTPIGEMKYFQRRDSGVHAYLPPPLSVTVPRGDLFIIEGEFKALALSESGFPAIGSSGFYGWRKRDEEGQASLVHEFADVVAHLRPSRILFCGDSDTALNYQFADAAVSLARLVAVPVLLPRIPIGGPGKGADDCKETLGTEFPRWWNERVKQAIAVVPKIKASVLAVELLRCEEKGIAELSGSAREDAERRLAKLGASITADPLSRAKVVNFAEKVLGTGRAVFNRAVKAAAVEGRQKKEESEDEAASLVPEVTLNAPAATWTRDLWKIFGPKTYWHAENLCRLLENELKPQSPSELVSFLDDPAVCRFVNAGKDGEAVRAAFGEKDARIFQGSWANNHDLIRSVTVRSPVPVLAWNGTSAELVNGYSRELGILAGGDPIELPAPVAAVKNLGELLRDYDFSTAGDAGRAIAFFLTPGLVQGGFLGLGRVPFFVVKKNQLNAGGSLLIRLVSMVYGLPPQPITNTSAPDKALEDISKALLSGAGFVYFDNVRGNGLKNLPQFESLLTEPTFKCRALYVQGEADVRKRTFAMSSNGAVLSPDLADRAVEIIIRKQPANYPWFPWPEGEIEEHVAANRLKYLASIFSLVKAWADAGRPGGKRRPSGIRYKQWEKAANWILEAFFPDLPLLDAGRGKVQERMADPTHDLLRTLFATVIQRGIQAALPASGFAELGGELGLVSGDKKETAMRLGRELKKRFPANERYDFDGEAFTITRTEQRNESGSHDIAFYKVQRGGQDETEADL
jgi:hypothetical protein